MNFLGAVEGALHVGLGHTELDDIDGGAAGVDGAFHDLLISSQGGECLAVVSGCIDSALLEAIFAASEVFKDSIS